VVVRFFFLGHNKLGTDGLCATGPGPRDCERGARGIKSSDNPDNPALKFTRLSPLSPYLNSVGIIGYALDQELRLSFDYGSIFDVC
jgi:hypothetical protein